LDFIEITEEEAGVVCAPGGGGWGNPLNRDPELVRKDTRNGIISQAKARDIYGVVLDTSSELFIVDYPATEKRRQQMKGNQPA
jgi:N-methylhydantoinase B